VHTNVDSAALGHFDWPNLVSLCRINGKLWIALA
jgi:hypothetical protein